MSDEPARLPRFSRRGIRVIALLIAVGALLLLGMWAYMIRMPGDSHEGPLPELSPTEAAFRDECRRIVQTLAGDIGERNAKNYPALQKGADFIESELNGYGGYTTSRQGYDDRGLRFENIAAELAGSSNSAEIVVIGAHYDAVEGSPAANDNGSGVAAMLALARSFAGKAQARTLRFVAFANEEPPHFQTGAMGSLIYAKACQERGDRVTAMLSLETMAYYSDEAGSQRYPFPFSVFYPDVGNFIAIVGDLSSRALVHQVVDAFRRHARFPSEGAAVSRGIPGIGWSDHWSFWQAGYPAVMVTDTAPFRYPHYHRASDTPDKLDYDKLARVVAGLEGVVTELAN